MSARRNGTRAAAGRDGHAPAVDLRVRVGPFALRNPILTASGTFGYGDEYAHVVDLKQLDGVITKTVTLAPRPGNAPVRIAETPSGMINSIGLENVGLERYLREKLPRLRSLGATVIVSVGGETPRELMRLVDALGEAPDVAGFEINFSCPNVSKGGARYWAVPRRLERTVGALRRLTRRPLIAKLSPDVTSISDLARACEQGGADALTAVNTFVGMSVDLEHGRNRLNRATGGLSGPAIKPLALARCHEAVNAVAIPVIGSDGAMSGRDVLEFLAIGARAVQIGTASFIRPRAAQEVIDEMTTWLAAHGHRTVESWIGCLKDGGVKRPAAPHAAPEPTPARAETRR